VKKKIVILNGDTDPAKTPVNQFLSDLEMSLEENRVEVKSYILREKKVKHCAGCFDCWLKTPGVCRYDDDVEDILREIITSDLLLYASPLVMGMYSAVLKRFQDRMIPIVHPYIEMVNNECHHRKRYQNYPMTGFLFEEGDSSLEEIENVRFIYERIVLNMYSKLLFFESVQKNNPKQLSHAISNF